MEKNEIRAVIKYLCLKKMSAADIHKDMQETLQESAPKYSTVTKWVREFKCGRQSTEDEPRSGRPDDASNPEMVERVHQLVLEERRIKVKHIAYLLNISCGTVHHILTDILGLRKLSARWVPRMLTDENKRQRLQSSTQLLAQMNSSPMEFLSRIVTQDETWVHHFTPEGKRQSMEWRHHGSPAPRKFKVVPSAGKVMASVFWDASGILLVDYLPKGQTITGLYYSNLLKKLREAIVSKRRGKLRRGVLLLQDNAPVHTSLVARATATECGFDLLPHPPYSPDLAPSDFYLFPKLKSELAGRRFHSDDEVIAAVDTFFDHCDRSFFQNGLEMLEARWSKCIARQGDYVEK
jgi:histone-lysine N-methyltransferase SETMAR